MGKKKKEERAVKQAARQLGVTYQKGMGVGDLIRSEADRMVKQSAASLGVDRDQGRGWRGLSTSRRDLSPIDQDRLIDVANYLAFQNPLGSRIHQVQRDFVIGEGVSIEADDKDNVQPIIDEFWNDPVNNFDDLQFDLVDYLGINGELFLPVFVTPTTGETRIGWLDPVEVEGVIPDTMNRRVMRTVKMKYGAGAGASAYYDLGVNKQYAIANVNTDPQSLFTGFRTGEVLVHRVNCAPDATRGRSDYEAVADILDLFDQASFTAMERASFLLSFIWDVKLTGKSEPEIQKWLEDQSAPKPGSVRAHNENVEWKDVTPQLQAGDMENLLKGFRQTALGARGMSDIFFGITDQTNRAGSEGVELPVVKAFTSRQRKCKAMFRETIDFAIDQKLLRNRALKERVLSGEISRAFKVNMPEISVKDLSKIGAMLNQMTAALDWATDKQIIKKETAARAFSSLIAQVGIEYDPTIEMQEAEAAAAEEVASGAKDYGTAGGKKIADEMAATLKSHAVAVAQGSPSQPRAPLGTNIGGEWIGKGPVSSVRAARALASYNPATKAKQVLAAKYERSVATGIGGKDLPDNEPFDVLKGEHAIEVKAIIAGKNPKITMHKESLARKNAFLGKSKMKGHTVAIDARGRVPRYFYQQGLGSFRLKNMREVSLPDLKGIFK